jgi:hypothetical protein
MHDGRNNMTSDRDIEILAETLSELPTLGRFGELRDELERRFTEIKKEVEALGLLKTELRRKDEEYEARALEAGEKLSDLLAIINGVKKLTDIPGRERMTENELLKIKSERFFETDRLYSEDTGICWLFLEICIEKKELQCLSDRIMRRTELAMLSESEPKFLLEMTPDNLIIFKSGMLRETRKKIEEFIQRSDINNEKEKILRRKIEIRKKTLRDIREEITQ